MISCYTSYMAKIRRIYIGDKLGYGTEEKFRAELGLAKKSREARQKSPIVFSEKQPVLNLQQQTKS
jgi:hypothetical protein